MLSKIPIDIGRIKKEDLDKEISGIEISALKTDVIPVSSDTTRVSKTKDWYKNIRKDIYLNETVSIMDDIK